MLCLGTVGVDGCRHGRYVEYGWSDGTVIISSQTGGAMLVRTVLPGKAEFLAAAAPSNVNTMKRVPSICFALRFILAT